MNSLMNDEFDQHTHTQFYQLESNLLSKLPLAATYYGVQKMDEQLNRTRLNY